MTSTFQALIVAAGLVSFHAPDGHEVLVNPSEITVLHQKLSTNKQGHFTDNATCLINLTDGKFVAIVESCLDVLDAIKRNQQR